MIHKKNLKSPCLLGFVLTAARFDVIGIENHCFHCYYAFTPVN